MKKEEGNIVFFLFHIIYVWTNAKKIWESYLLSHISLYNKNIIRLCLPLHFQEDGTDSFYQRLP